MATTLDLTIIKGDTFTATIRWEVPPFVYKPITAIAKTAPIRVTAVGHGLRSGWRAAVVSVVGMEEANAVETPPADTDYRPVTVTDTDTVEFNEVNAAGFSTYQSGGYLQFYTPASLSGFTARMTIRDRIGGTELVSLTTENGRITLDDTTHTIVLLLSAADTAVLQWRKGVYDLEMVSGGVVPVVTKLYSGLVFAVSESTT